MVNLGSCLNLHRQLLTVDSTPSLCGGTAPFSNFYFCKRGKMWLPGFIEPGFLLFMLLEGHSCYSGVTEKAALT